ncbi:MAG: RNA polymerase sigma factor [Rhodospirillales bacterium]|nr:RNA polymerase sigma factor [Rhodospirillales bacterium]
MSRLEPLLPRLYRYAFSLARNDDGARDLVQQCALKALTAKNTPDADSAYRAWLFVILRNAFIDSVRRKGATDSIFDPQALENCDEKEMEYWGGEERFINTLAVKQAMRRLKARDREIIGLVDLAGLSYAEAAGVIGIPQGTVMSRISRARDHLLALLEKGTVEVMPSRRAGIRQK